MFLSNYPYYACSDVFKRYPEGTAKFIPTKSQKLKNRKFGNKRKRSCKK